MGIWYVLSESGSVGKRDHCGRFSIFAENWNFSSILIVSFGVMAGILAALRQNKLIDRLLMVLSTLGSTIPSFVFATLYLFMFSKILGLVPAFGVGHWKGYIGPILVTSVFSMAFVTRLMRTSMIEELNQDYIRTAKAKGLSSFKTLFKHALRNALIPVITNVGIQLGHIMAGSVVIESIFGIAGIGDEHLDLLAKICEVLEDETVLEEMKTTNDVEWILKQLT